MIIRTIYFLYYCYMISIVVIGFVIIAVTVVLLVFVSVPVCPLRGRRSLGGACTRRTCKELMGDPYLRDSSGFYWGS